MSWGRREGDGHRYHLLGGGWMEGRQQQSGRTHIWEHFEDLGGDGEDPAGVHFVPQLGARGGVPLGGEQEGRSIAAARQGHPAAGGEEQGDE